MAKCEYCVGIYTRLNQKMISEKGMTIKQFMESMDFSKNSEIIALNAQKDEVHKKYDAQIDSEKSQIDSKLGDRKDEVAGYKKTMLETNNKARVKASEGKTPEEQKQISSEYTKKYMDARKKYRSLIDTTPVLDKLEGQKSDEILALNEKIMVIEDHLAKEAIVSTDFYKELSKEGCIGDYTKPPSDTNQFGGIVFDYDLEGANVYTLVSYGNYTGTAQVNTQTGQREDVFANKWKMNSNLACPIIKEPIENIQARETTTNNSIPVELKKEVPIQSSPKVTLPEPVPQSPTSSSVETLQSSSKDIISENVAVPSVPSVPSVSGVGGSVSLGDPCIIPQKSAAISIPSWESVAGVVGVLGVGALLGGVGGKIGEKIGAGIAVAGAAAAIISKLSSVTVPSISSKGFPSAPDFPTPSTSNIPIPELPKIEMRKPPSLEPCKNVSQFPDTSIPK